VCRLFAMTGGGRRVRATFWLLDAPDSLVRQAHSNADGTGLGVFDENGTPIVHRAPIAAYEDLEFAREAKEVGSTTFVAHVRLATTGVAAPENVHPFEQDGRLFAHNGLIRELPELERRLGEHRTLVQGDTDSERFFALITREIESNGGDVGAGIAAAALWISDNLPLYSLNCVVTTTEELWALRYPDTRELFILERAAGGPRGDRHFDGAGKAGILRVRSHDLARAATAIVASERIDEHPEWRLLAPGELIRVNSRLEVRSEIVLPNPPARLLSDSDLHPHEVRSQHPVPPAE
jgi:predicted glutamine amidotransferase